MKRIVYSIILVAVFALSSCEDFLDTESKSSQSADMTFASLTDANLAILGAYALMCEDAMYSSRMSIFWMTNTDIEITSFGDADYKNADRRGLSNYFSRPTMDMADITNPWNNMYKAIEYLNLCIKYIPQSPVASGSDDNASKIWAYYGEALTLRALFYTELCRQYGDVPLRTEPAGEETFYIERTDRDVIYEHLLTDLEEAQKYLPYVNQSEFGTIERATKGFAKGLRARIALYRAGYSLRADGNTRQGSNPSTYYEIAKKESQELIAAGIHKLTPDFHSYFITQCTNKVDDVNRESLFEVGFGIGKSGEIAYSNGTRFDAASKYSGRNTQGYINTTPVFFYSFDPSDKRLPATVEIYTYCNPTSNTADTDEGPAGMRQKIVVPKDWRIGKWSIKWLTGAALTGSVGTDQKYTNGINWPIMRIADVYLMLAESEFMLNGPTDVAKEALKVVRRRAFPTDQHDEKVEQYVNNLTQTDFFDAIVNERAWELAGEGVRKYDLIRWNKLAEKLQDFKTENLTFLQTGNLPSKYPNSKYNPIPNTIYYKFITGTDYPEIDYSTVNFYETLPAAPGTDYYTYTNWVRISESNMTTYQNWLNLANSGYVPSANNHLFALPSSVVSTSGGLWGNDPYWNNLP